MRTPWCSSKRPFSPRRIEIASSTVGWSTNDDRGWVCLGEAVYERQDALDRAGGHDRTYTFYGDDTDLAQRLHGQGKTVWRNSFFIYTLSRRFDEAGIISMSIKYVLNYWWPVLFHRPFNQFHKDIRVPNI